MLKIGSIRWRGKCPRHPGFDPYLDGRGAIVGGCEKCTALADIYSHHVQMLALMRGFTVTQKPKKRPPQSRPDLQENLFGEIQ